MKSLTVGDDWGNAVFEFVEHKNRSPEVRIEVIVRGIRKRIYLTTPQLRELQDWIKQSFEERMMIDLKRKYPSAEISIKNRSYRRKRWVHPL